MPTEASPDDLLTLKDIGGLLKLSNRTLSRLAQEGLLPPPTFRVGNVRRWKRRLIMAWIDTGGEALAKSGQTTPKVDKRRHSKTNNATGDSAT